MKRVIIDFFLMIILLLPSMGLAVQSSGAQTHFSAKTNSFSYTDPQTAKTTGATYDPKQSLIIKEDGTSIKVSGQYDAKRNVWVFKDDRAVVYEFVWNGSLGVYICPCTIVRLFPVCGDGIWTPSLGEACDATDPNYTPPPGITCNNQCEEVAGQTGCKIADFFCCPSGNFCQCFPAFCPPPPPCGNGVLDLEETCDPMLPAPGIVCRSDCHYCGDNSFQPKFEECDGGFPADFPEGATCNNCIVVPPACGDGVINQAGETCDGEDYCRSNCTYCGDGNLNAGEQCDDGNNNNGDGCHNDCTLATCGDGVLDPGETCEPTISPDTNCRLEDCHYCGDGSIQAGFEACDGAALPAGAPAGATCNQCELEFCGDGVQQAGEQCDDGNSIDTDGCRNSCTLPVCGDGILDSGEECDDGNLVNTDACRNNCQLPRCGDTIVDAPGEQCDDGNDNNGDECNNSCSFTCPPPPPSSVQCPPITCDFWTRTYPNAFPLRHNDIAVDSCGNTYISSNRTPDNDPTGILYITKLDPCGTEQWTTTAEEIDFQIGGITIDNENNPYTNGTYIADGNRYVFIRKYNSLNGSLEWRHVYNQPSFNYGGDITFGPDDNIRITGGTETDGAILLTYSKTGGSGGNPWWIINPVPFDLPPGYTLESEYYEGIDLIGRCEAIYNVTDNRLVLDDSSDSYQYPYRHRILVTKIRMDGTEDITFGTGGTVVLNNAQSRHYRERGGIATDPQGTFLIVTGRYQTPEPASPLITKLNANTGTVISTWIWPWPIISPRFGEVAVDSESNVYVIGRADYQTSAGYQPAFVAKFDANGVGLWLDIIDRPPTFDGIDQMGGIDIGPDDSAHVVGVIPFLTGYRSIFIRKYTPCGVSDDGPPDVQNDPACAGP